MIKKVNPFNREPVVFDTTKKNDLTPNAICNCICNVPADNNSSGIWASRLSFNLICGCACNNSSDNKSANNTKDKDR